MIDSSPATHEGVVRARPADRPASSGHRARRQAVRRRRARIARRAAARGLRRRTGHARSARDATRTAGGHRRSAAVARGLPALHARDRRRRQSRGARPVRAARERARPRCATCGRASSTRRSSTAPTSRASAALASSRRCSPRTARPTCPGRRRAWARARRRRRVRLAEAAEERRAARLGLGLPRRAGRTRCWASMPPSRGRTSTASRPRPGRPTERLTRDAGAGQLHARRRVRGPRRSATSARSRPASSPISSCCPAIS